MANVFRKSGRASRDRTLPRPLGNFAPWVILWLAASAAVACRSHAETGDSQEPARLAPECDAFLSAYGRCLDVLGPEAIAKARVDQARAGLLGQVGHDEVSHAALGKQCAVNLSQVRGTCASGAEKAQ
jgi:hypothetical protein